MNQFSIKSVTIILSLISGVFHPVFGAELSARAILDSLTAVMHPQSASGKMEQEIISSGNVKRVFTFEYFSENKGKNVLIRYREPRKVKNNAFLIKKNGEDIWVYFLMHSPTYSPFFYFLSRK